MAKIAKDYDKRKTERNRDKIASFCNTRIARKVERLARKGKSSCVVRVPKHISVCEVYDYLRERDYRVTEGIKRVTIEW